MAPNELQPLDLNEAEEVLETKPNEVKAKLREEPEVRRLAEQIDYKNQLALLEYGKETANEISSFSGKVLSTIKSSSMEESSQLLKQLLHFRQGNKQIRYQSIIRHFKNRCIFIFIYSDDDTAIFHTGKMLDCS